MLNLVKPSFSSRLLLLCNLSLCLFSSQSAFSQGTNEVSELPPPAKRFALLIGVGKYRDAGITALDGPTHDVEKLKMALVTYVGLDPKNVFTLTSDARNDLELPTKDNIIRKLNYLNFNVGGGLLIVAFSGHGIQKDCWCVQTYRIAIRRPPLMPSDCSCPRPELYS
jgi:hypothetical protein